MYSLDAQLWRSSELGLKQEMKVKVALQQLYFVADVIVKVVFSIKWPFSGHYFRS